MKTLEIDPIRHPNRVYRIDQFSVPEEARGEFEAAMRRNLTFLSTLRGFLGHVAFTKVGGTTRFHYATIAAWEDADAIAAASEAIGAFMEQIGFDLAAKLAEWGAEAERGGFIAPPNLQ